VQIVGSVGELLAAPDGTLASATIRDELVIDPGSGLPPLRSVATYRFAYLGDGVVARPDDRLAALEPLAWRSIDQPAPPEANELDLDLSKVAGYTRVGEIVAELDRLDVARIPGDADRYALPESRLDLHWGVLPGRFRADFSCQCRGRPDQVRVRAGS